MPLSACSLVTATGLGLGVLLALWWALADFVFDHIGPAPTEWTAIRRNDRVDVV